MKLKAAFPHVRFLQTFGTSETGIISTVSKSSTSTFLKFDDPDTEYKVVDGELWLRTKTQVMGYLNAKAERFTEDGWFRTGDFVEEKDGFLRIVGRNSDMINVGGEKVMPEEVETVLLQMPGVEDVTVYGESNPITGQAVACKIKHRDAAMTPLEIKKEVRKFCKTRLASYKIPVRVVLMEQVEYTKRFKKKR
ncbi:MAG: fatty acid--CoA ligase family protein [Selenomonas bovis]|nr:fatty acid--CoA ligase family protein [Selenomonas bovis]